MTEKIQASENLGKFFKKIMALKEYVKKEMKNKNDPVLNEVYERLDDAFKSTTEIKP